MSAFDGRVFAGVIFDLDGTLVSSLEAVVRSWSQVAQEYGRSFDDLGDMHGVPARDLVQRLGLDADPAEVLARVTELEVADTQGVIALPGADFALRHLPSDRIAIATSCTRALAEARLKAAGLPAPTVMVTADDVRFGKPSPDPFMLAARRLGVSPKDCLALEDSPAGLLAARRAECATIAVGEAEVDDTVADAWLADLSKVYWQMSPTGIAVRLA